MPLFEFNARPLELAEYPRALASLRESSLLAEIKERSSEQDLPHLRIALAAGVFDAEPFIDEVFANPIAAAAVQHHWMTRCSAMMSVMGLTTISKVTEVDEGRRYPVALNLREDTQDFMVEYIDHLAVQVKQWRERLGNMAVNETGGAVNQAMHLACMIDRPDALQTLLAACPHAIHLPMPDAKIGGGAMTSQRQEDGVTMEVMPLFTAMQFSSPRCVEKLLAEVGQSLTLYNKFEENKAKETVGFLKSFSDVQHRGSTSAMVPVMKHFLTRFVEEDDEGDVEKSLLGTIEKILHRNGPSSKNTNVIPAALEAGWFDVAPNQLLRTSLRHGHAPVIDHFKDRMPWVFVAHLGMEVGQTARRALEDGRSRGYQSLATIAKNDGPIAMAAVLRNFAVEGELREGMAHALVRLPSGRQLLPMLLGIGLDPHWNVPEEKKSLLDYAKHANSESFNVMTSFLARRRAHSLIDELGAPTCASKP